MSQTISQLQQVCEFLVASLNGAIRKNNIDAWQERGKLIICNSDQGQDGYLVARWKHTAIIAIEKFPHKKVNPYNLFAMVCAFLIDSEWQRDEFGLDDPEIDIDLISDDNATVLIELELMDDIELIPDDNGPVQFNGACIMARTNDLDWTSPTYGLEFNQEVSECIDLRDQYYGPN